MSGSVFLTGANGFLGSRLLALLAADGNRRVVCLYRRESAECRYGKVESVRGDLLDCDSYAGAMAGCDTVLHLAAATGKRPPAEYLRVNRDGTEALAIAAQQAGVQRFLHVSTIAVKFRDMARYYYAQSKQQAESVVAQSGLRWTIVRPTITLGRNAPVLGSLSRLAALPVVPVFGDGRAPVQPIFVDDLASCLIALLEEGAFDRRTVDIGGPEVLSIEDLLLRIRRAQGRGRARVIHLPARAMASCLGWMEPVWGSLLPVTAGQLASFVNDGTIAPDPWVTQRHPRMKRVDEMLQLVTHELSPA